MNYGCKGAMANGYVKWLVDTKAALSSESFYPYKVNTQSGGGYKKTSHITVPIIFVWPTTSTTICCCFSTTTQQQTYSLAYALEIFQSINE